MKIAKKVLIGLLAVAVLVSGLLVWSFAEDVETPGADTSVTVPDYADVLKYYDPLFSTLYLNESYEDGTYGEEVFVSRGSASNFETKIKSYAGDNYLQIKLGHILDPDSAVDVAYRVNLGETVDKALFSADIAASHEAVKGKLCPGCGNTESRLTLSLCPSCGTEFETVASDAPVVSLFVSQTDMIGAALITFDYTTGRVTYNHGDGYSVVEGLTASEDQWYSVSVVFAKTMYSYKITTLVNGEKKVYEMSDIASPINTISSVGIGSEANTDSRCGIIKIDDFFVQRGLDNRTVGIDVAAKTAEGIALIRDIVLNSAIAYEVKLDAISVYDQLVGAYADKLVHSEEVDAIIAELEDTLLKFFGDSLVSLASAIDPTNSYNNRVKFIADNQLVIDRVSEFVSENDVAYIAALEAFKAEADILAVLEVNSLAFQEYLSDYVNNHMDIISSHEYDVLKSFVEATEAEFEPDGVKIYDPTYPALKDSYALYAVTSANYHNGVKNAEIFCANITVAAAAEAALAEGFTGEFTAEQFEASLAAYDIIVELNFDNDTFPGMEEALQIFEGLNNLRSVSDIAVRFIDYVDTAEQAIYIFQVEEWLDLAAQYIDEDKNSPNPYYPGIEEALQKYNALRLDIDTKKANADAYIKAVGEINGKTGDALIEAIENALALRELGNILGYEGVSEANIALDNAKSSEELRVLYAEKFIALVAAIDEDADLETRYEQLHLAKQAENKADASIEGVSEAKETLKNASIAYSAAIAEINGSFTDVINGATGIAVSLTSASDIAKMIISAIKALVA